MTKKVFVTTSVDAGDDVYVNDDCNRGDSFACTFLRHTMARAAAC